MKDVILYKISYFLYKNNLIRILCIVHITKIIILSPTMFHKKKKSFNFFLYFHKRYKLK